MKIVTLNLYVFFVLAALVIGSLIMSQTTPSYTNILEPTNVYSISSSNDEHPVNTFVWSSPSNSPFSSSSSSSSSSATAVTSSSINAEMSDVLTASFTNIIDTQIYTGLDRITN
jgi:hypothetical protein